MKKAPTYESTEFDSLNDLLDEWKDEDDDTNLASVDASSSSSKTTSSNPVSVAKSDDIVNVRTEAQLFV